MQRPGSWFPHFSTISPVIFCLTFITSLTNGADPLEFKLAYANPIIRQLRPLDCDFVAAICFYFSNVIICDYNFLSFFWLDVTEGCRGLDEEKKQKHMHSIKIITSKNLS